jgi:hypothetical protein
MCAQLSPEDKLFISQISARIVRMFQQYAQNIEPESEHFLTFISQYLAERNVKNPRSIPYSELYGHIKEGIRDYLRQPESEGKENEPRTKSR